MGQLAVPLVMGWGWGYGAGWCYGAAHGSPGYGVGMVLWGSSWFPWLWGGDGSMGQDGAMGQGWCYGAAHGFPAYGAEMGIWGSLWLWGRDGAMGQPVVPLVMGRGYGAVGSERSTLQPIPDPPLGVRGQQLAISN